MGRFDYIFKPLTEADLALLHSWLQRPHVTTGWPSPATLEELREEYLPAATYGAARPFLAYLGGGAIGYIQYYVVSEGGEAWWPDTPPSGTVGIDQFLADPSRLGQGLGTSMVEQFAAFLFRDLSISQIRVDPRPDNTRAIRCYLNAGFRRIGSFTSPDGPAVLMVLDRKNHLEGNA